MDATRSPETLVVTGATWSNITEDGIFIVTAMETPNLAQQELKLNSTLIHAGEQTETAQ
jgi:hypothetical protein